MAILGFQEFMLPILQYFSDNQEHSVKETNQYIENYFVLSQEDREKLLPSGKKRVAYDRTSWAITYLKTALLIQSTRRGVYSITDRGHSFLSTQPIELTVRYLTDNYEEIRLKIKGFNDKNTNEVEILPPKEAQDLSPEEVIEANFESIQESLSQELLELILQNSPAYFEKLVIDLLVNMGYGGNRKEAGQAVGKSGDEGIDGVINEDRLGLDNIYVQAKRWAIDNTVGRPEIQKFVGALAGKQASKGIFITTSSFSSEARNYVQTLQPKVILIDGRELTQFMIEYDVGVSTYNTYVIKKIDTDYFEEV
ncbi:MAG: restriction endonuclease [Eubacteriales bacterium]